MSAAQASGTPASTGLSRPALKSLASFDGSSSESVSAASSDSWLDIGKAYRERGTRCFPLAKPAPSTAAPLG